MPSGPRVRANNVYGTLDVDLGALITNITMQSIGLQLLPNIATGHAVIVLDPKRETGQPEIVLVTTHAGGSSSATITRAAYGTTNRAHLAGTDWAHVTIDEDYVEVLTSTTRPLDPYMGQTIFETDSLSFRHFTPVGGWDSSPPVGTLLPYLGSVAPDGYIMADGVPALRVGATSRLYEVIQDTYPGGNGTTTFGIPNMRGRVPVGRNAAEAEFDVLGETGGFKTVTLTQAQMPVHVHGITDPTHNHGQTTHAHGNDAHDHGATSDDNETGNHQHRSTDFGQPTMVIETGAGPFGWGSGSRWHTFDVGHTSLTSWSGSHNHDIWTDVHPAGVNIHGNYANIQAAGTGVTVNQAGTSEAHTNLQPYLVVNYIVKI